MVVCKQSEYGCGRKGHRYLNPHGAVSNNQGENHRGQPEYNQDIENIAAHDITDGDFGVSLDGGKYINNQFRRGSSEGDNSQTDYQVTDFECSRNGRRPFDNKVGPLDQQDKTNDNQYINHHNKHQSESPASLISKTCADRTA